SEAVFAHEFHHIVQFGSNSYWSQDAFWYWEASASWFADLAVPETYNQAYDGALFRMMPHIPLDYFVYGDGSLLGYHQYAASLFLIAVTEAAGGDVSIVRDSWLGERSTADPIEVLDG